MSNETEQENEDPQPQNKTVFSILSNLKQSTDQTSETDRRLNTDADPELDDISFLKNDPGTNQKFINKSVYLKLHRSLSPNRSIVVDKIKEKYEHLNNDQTYQDDSVTTEKTKETLESIKHKYSPAGVGYRKFKVPIPKPRQRISLIKSKEVFPNRKKIKGGFLNYSNTAIKQKQDFNSNNLNKKETTNYEQKELDEDDDDEFFTIVTRSDSEESIFKIQKELAVFTMDKKKRTNSFRKLFSGKIFGSKDKKKQNDENDTSLNRRAEISTENNHNECQQFNRQSPYRHTIGGETNTLSDTRIQRSDINSSQKCEKHYAPAYSKHKSFEQNFENPQQTNKVLQAYVPMDKPIFKSNDPNVYIQISNARRYNDDSSSASASTLESERSHLYQNQSFNNQDAITCGQNISSISNKMNDCKRDTPPRALETRQDVKLVSPKALIPTNSERSLPNLYQSVSGKKNDFLPNYANISPNILPTKKNNSESPKPEHFEDLYGTVFDSVEHQRYVRNTRGNQFLPILNEDHKPPRSPSLEASKLKLPVNRNVVPLSPRVRSPIPQEHVSTEKIIATELLKPKGSPTFATHVTKGHKDTIFSQHGLELDIDSPDNVDCQNKDTLLRNNWYGKPPIGQKNIAKLPLRRSLDDSKSSNDLSSVDQISPRNIDPRRIDSASPIRGYKIDFRLPSPIKGVSNQKENKKNEVMEDMPVELGTKPTISMTKTFINTSRDRLGPTRRFYEVGHIDQVNIPTTNSNVDISPVKPEFNDQKSHAIGSNHRISIPSSESLNRVGNVVCSPSPIFRSPTPNKSNSSRQSISMSPIRPSSGRSLSRPTTPLNASIPESPKTTPQKEEIRKNVEAYYWSEIRKLKDKENYDLYLYQLQYANLLPQSNAFAEADQISRSRSMSPSTHRNSRRSLSLPRDGRSKNNPNLEETQPTPKTATIANNIHSKSSQQIQFQGTFVRNCSQRSTIDGSSGNRSFDTSSIYRPIFKRGSLSTPPKQVYEDQLKRKVSFSRNGRENVQAWPTRNGFTKSPPQRRVEKANFQVINNQDHFPSNTANSSRYDYPPDSIEVTKQAMESIYSSRDTRFVSNGNFVENFNQTNSLENQYGQRLANNNGIVENPYEQRLTNNAVMVENPYGQRQTNRAGTVENPYGHRLTNNAGMIENPYGQRQTNNAVTAENPYGQRQTNTACMVENPYGQKKTNNAGTVENPYGQRMSNNIIMENPYGQRIGNQVIFENPYGYRVERNIIVENPYGQQVLRQNIQQSREALYGQPLDAIKHGLTRHGSIQMRENVYGQRVQVPIRPVSHQSHVPVRVSSAQEPVYGARRETNPLKRQVIVKDEIFGQFGGYVSSEQNGIIVHRSSKENMMDYNARVKEEYLRRMPQKQITVNNKVCDFYGQIHDTDSAGKLQSNGVLMGQLQRNPTSPLIERNSYSNLPSNQNFTRNNRLTSSATDMGRRVPNLNRNNEIVYSAIYTNNGQSVNGAPTRPLPPIPPSKIKTLGRTVQVSDTESSDASEVQRILNSKTKAKNKGFFGK